MKKDIFIIHGWTYSLEKWGKICEILKSNNINPIMLKVPGLTQPSNKVWDIEGYVDWLDDKLSGEIKPIVIGHSNGGRIALSFVQKNPGRINKLILIDSAGIPHNQGVSRIKLKILWLLAKIGKLFSYIPPLKKAFYKVIGAQDYYNAPPNMKITMQNMLSADKNLNLASLNVPLSIIWGRDDSITPLADGQKFQSSIEGAKLFIVDNARHAPFISHPKEVAKIILDQLK